MSTTDLVTVLCGIAIGIGVLGTVVPVLPGTLTIAIAVLVWAIVVSSSTGWAVLAIVLVLLGSMELIKYLVAGKRVTASGVPRRTLAIAGLAGVIGFFVIPLLGLPIGFVLTLTLLEYDRNERDWSATWASTKAALLAVGLVMLMDVAAALLAATAWGIGVWRLHA
ncbi:MAG: DUF456 domain-containing protein [Actinomycetales bacterium]